MLFVNPLINLCQRSIALTAACTARSAQRQFTYFAFADPFIQHAPQGIGIHVEMDN